jgi:predicted lipoprotein
VTFYDSTLAVPAMRDVEDDQVQTGAKLLDSIGCAGCHTQTPQTGPSSIDVLANQTIHPYTDLLLHDMKATSWVTMAVLGVVMTLVVSCRGLSRGEVLTDVAESNALPLYQLFEQSTSELVTATQELCDSPNEATLNQAHEALAYARGHWSRTEAIWIGPVMKRRSWAVVDWPINADEIDELIADESVVLDLERFSKGTGADQRGLGAVEYVLGYPGDSSELSTRFSARRCDYLSGVTEVIHEEAVLLRSAWVVDFENGGPFGEQFAAEEAMVLDSLINDSLFLLEDIADRELGPAIGATGDEADIDAIIEGPSSLGTADIAGHLMGLRSMLIGDGFGDGIAPLLGDDIVSRLDDQFDVAEKAVGALGSPLQNQVLVNPGGIAKLRDAIKVIQVTLATEVVTRLGGTIGFSDADGDTGAQHRACR